MARIAEVRPSPIAGRWYPGSAKLLGEQIDQFLAQAKLPELSGEVVALIAPHAGYQFSGRTAGVAFCCVQGRSYELVAVVSPLHAYCPAPFLTSAHQAYATPLGSVPVDTQALAAVDAALQAEGGRLVAVAEDGEHSLEIELPFLQRALAAEFKLLPLMVRSRDLRQIEALGKALAAALRGRSALLVASTDLSHNHSQAEANRLDAEMLRRVESFSPRGVLDAEEDGSGSACGAGAVAAVLQAARLLGADHVQILHHSTSADETGDTSSVVGYGAAVALRTPPD